MDYNGETNELFQAHLQAQVDLWDDVADLAIRAGATAKAFRLWDRAERVEALLAMVTGRVTYMASTGRQQTARAAITPRHAA